MVKRVLMIAYHYPPMLGGSGIQRTLSFTRHLPQLGWQPLVLSVRPGAYASASAHADTSDRIAASAYAHAADTANADPGAEADAGANCGVEVYRSFALDSARHLAVRGRYPALLAQPDRWISWWLSAVPAGLRLIRLHRPDVIWSSYPIATAHLIALTLHRLTGIPWIADQRDPMIDTDYPPDPRRRRIHGWIEQQAIQRSAAMVCTTPGAVRDLGARFPQSGQQRIELIENGYDESSFITAETAAPQSRPPAGQFRLLHSGVIYPSERDPGPLFAALARLMADGAVTPANFRLVLRATGHDNYLQDLIRRHPGLGYIIELAPQLPYQDALAEMIHADGLLLLQAANCNGQIPAKMYDYLRARRPILALTHPDGDTAAALRRHGIDTICRLDSAGDIAGTLPRFLRLCRANQAPLAAPGMIAHHSRAARTRELAALLDRIYRKEPL